MQMKTSTVIETTPPDLVTMLGVDVIESHLRLTYADESLYIDALAAAAVRAVEYEADEHHGTGTISFYSSAIPSTQELGISASRFTPTAVEYKDADGVWNELDSDTYEFTSQGNPTLFVYNELTAPDGMNLEGPENFRILGTLAALDMKANLQQAALLMLAHLYQNREAVSNEKVYDLPLAFTYLIGKTRNTPLR